MFVDCSNLASISHLRISKQSFIIIAIFWLGLFFLPFSSLHTALQHCKRCKNLHNSGKCICPSRTYSTAAQAPYSVEIAIVTTHFLLIRWIKILIIYKQSNLLAYGFRLPLWQLLLMHSLLFLHVRVFFNELVFLGLGHKTVLSFLPQWSLNLKLNLICSSQGRILTHLGLLLDQDN